MPETLGATNNRDQRALRVGQSLVQRLNFGGQQWAGDGNFGMPDSAFGRRLGAMGGGKGIHHENTSHNSAIFFASASSLAFFTLQKTDVFQQHQLAGLDVNAVDPVADQLDRLTQQLGQLLRDRLERELINKLTPRSDDPDATSPSPPPRRPAPPWRMVGSEAAIRASLVTCPSRMGTLRSDRIKTRRPLMSI